MGNNCIMTKWFPVHLVGRENTVRQAKRSSHLCYVRNKNIFDGLSTHARVFDGLSTHARVFDGLSTHARVIALLCY